MNPHALVFGRPLAYERSALLVAALAGILLSPRSSDAYELPRHAFAAAAARAASPAYRVGATLGEAGPVGETAGGSYRLALGFWWPSARVPVGVPAAGQAPAPPSRPAMRAPQPNPFASMTRLAYDVAEPAQVRLGIYDVTGRLVHTLVDRPHVPGRYAITWDGRDASGRALGSAVYFARLDVGTWGTVRTLLIVR